MPQAILLSSISTEFIGNPVRLFSPGSIKLQFTPRRDGFSAHVLIEISIVQNLGPGYLWYSIPTLGAEPWFPAVDLDFACHTDSVAFDMRLDPGVIWIRASVFDYSRGSVSAYIAH